MLFTLLAVIWYSEHTVKTFHTSCRQTIISAQEQVNNGNFSLAAQTLASGLETMRAQETRMTAFVDHELLTELDSTFHAALAFAIHKNEEEALAELARAESQLHRLEHQFFKLL